MRGLGPDVVSVVGPMGITCWIGLFYSSIQLYVVLSPYLCFIFFLIPDLQLYVLDNTSIR